MAVELNIKFFKIDSFPVRKLVSRNVTSCYLESNIKIFPLFFFHILSKRDPPPPVAKITFTPLSQLPFLYTFTLTKYMRKKEKKERNRKIQISDQS